MNRIFEKKNSVVLENDYIIIELSKKDALALDIIDKRDGKSIMSEDKSFFLGLYDTEENLITAHSLKFAFDTLVLECENGKIEFSVEAYDDHFILEVTSEKLPEGADFVAFGDLRLEYDYNEKNTLLAGGVSMTINTNPNYFPSGKDKKVLATAFDRLGGVKGAKFGFTVAPREVFRDALKNMPED